MYLLYCVVISGYNCHSKVDTMDKSEEERKKEVERIAQTIRPHDDEPDPTANIGNYNFPQMILLSAASDSLPCLSYLSMK